MRLVIATVALLAAACLALPASAQESQQCGPYKTIAAGLAEKFHEEPVSVALVQRGDDTVQIAITFASPLGETWTLVVADSKGEKGCIVMVGTQWEGARRQAPAQGPNT